MTDYEGQRTEVGGHRRQDREKVQVREKLASQLSPGGRPLKYKKVSLRNLWMGVRNQL